MDLANRKPTWEPATTVIFAGGPSITEEDVEHVRRRWGESSEVRMIAVNESWRLCDVAHAVYGADPTWWQERGPTAQQFQGERWTQTENWEKGDAERLGLKKIRSEPGTDISLDPSLIYQGSNSSFQAMNLAVLFGSRRIVFLGLDLCADGDKTHWHVYPDKFKRQSPGYGIFKLSFEQAAPKLAKLGIEVINASRRTALECFPRMSIQEALSCCK